MSTYEIPPAELTSAWLLSATDDLELIAQTVVEGFLHGLHRSPFVGFSVEFASHREYLPGDDLRYVNWRLFGRTDAICRTNSGAPPTTQQRRSPNGCPAHTRTVVIPSPG